MDTLPELLFSHAADPAQSKRVRRMAADGRVRKLYAGVYTSNLDGPADAIVLRHWHAIVGHLLPGGVVSHRSAIDGRPHEGRLVISRGSTRRTLELPGLAIEVLPGPAAVTEGATRDAPYGGLYISSEPRRFLENLTRGRAWAGRVIPQEALEAQLEKMLSLRGEHRLNGLRDACRALAGLLDMATEFKRLDEIISALLGTRTAHRLSARSALARAAGRPHDPARLELFETLFAALNREVFAVVSDPAATGESRENFAFFEAYFSNFIEGTTFTVNEAERIVFEGQIIENRSADSHDVLGTYAAATRPPWRDRPPADGDAFLAWLKSVNAQVMQQRPDKKPGEWKDLVNQAGSTLFVLPELVPGTLREGFERIRALVDPVARADDDVRRHRGASLHRRQRAHGSAGDERGTQRSTSEPHHHPDGISRGLSAAA